jgi:hypothetical protein
MDLEVKRAWRTKARVMTKIHVPAYWPVVEGAQELKKRGVLVEVVNMRDMLDMEVDVDMVFEFSVSGGQRDGGIEMQREKNNIQPQ